MKEHPLVSVLMTSYNREKYIGIAIESVLVSTYRHLELIIVDDGSKDHTVAIARSYAARDARVKVYINEKNLGDYPNRNQAARHAQGKYLKYVDADDYIYPWGLEILIQCMEQFPSAGWGICSLDQVKSEPFPLELTPQQAYSFHYLGKGMFQRAPLSSIIKREVFWEVGGFKPIRMAGDYEMWHRLGKSYNVVQMPKGIVWYREHAEQEMNDYFKYLSTYEGITAEYLRLPDCPLDKEVSLMLLKQRRMRYFKQIIKDVLRFKTGNVSYYVDCLKKLKN